MSTSRHLAAVPDDGPWRDLLAAIELVRGAPYEPHRAVVGPVRFRTLDPLGNLDAEPPGWWVCPDCGRRRDRAGEPRTVTSVLCTGPAAPYSRRHRPTEMRVQR